MTRFIVPLLMYATAGYLHWYNAGHADRKILFPFLELVPALKGNIGQQATVSFTLLCALATAMLLWAAFDYFRALRRNPPPTDPDQA
jgi:hypothetical protein